MFCPEEEKESYQQKQRSVVSVCYTCTEVPFFIYQDQSPTESTTYSYCLKTYYNFKLIQIKESEFCQSLINEGPL